MKLALGCCLSLVKNYCLLDMSKRISNEMMKALTCWGPGSTSLFLPSWHFCLPLTQIWAFLQTDCDVWCCRLYGLLCSILPCTPLTMEGVQMLKPLSNGLWGKGVFWKLTRISYLQVIEKSCYKDRILIFSVRLVSCLTFSQCLPHCTSPQALTLLRLHSPFLPSPTLYFVLNGTYHVEGKCLFTNFSPGPD